jgi:putative ABC transport system substrate-binding protein
MDAEALDMLDGLAPLLVAVIGETAFERVQDAARCYDFDAAFRSVGANGAQMVLVLSSPHFTGQQSWIAEQAIAHRLPTMFTFRNYVEAGGLMSYGVDFPSMFRKTADYVARILKGAKPADLPVEQATKFETVVNLQTAKKIGVELPTSILLRADKVIE